MSFSLFIQSSGFVLSFLNFSLLGIVVGVGIAVRDGDGLKIIPKVKMPTTLGYRIHEKETAAKEFTNLQQMINDSMSRS
jgi:hypothetical protein